MSVVKELIKTESDGSLSFGDYTPIEKQKKSDFEVSGDIYKIKTHKEVTKLEKNEMFIYESVPGTSVHSFKASADSVSFEVCGYTDSSITLELAPDTEYSVKVGDGESWKMTTKLGGKLSFSVELAEGSNVSVSISKA